MLNVVIFGAPGSGTGTQSELIIYNHGYFYISTAVVSWSAMKNGTVL